MSILQSTYYPGGIFAGFGATRTELKALAVAQGKLRAIKREAYKRMWVLESQFGQRQAELTEEWRGYFLGKSARPQVAVSNTIAKLQKETTRWSAKASQLAQAITAARQAQAAVKQSPLPQKPLPGGGGAGKPFPVVPVAIVGGVGLLGLFFITRRKR